jgi:hypothetical protein
VVRVRAGFYNSRADVVGVNQDKAGEGIRHGEIVWRV